MNNPFIEVTDATGQKHIINTNMIVAIKPFSSKSKIIYLAGRGLDDKPLSVIVPDIADFINAFFLGLGDSNSSISS